jgi:hypothetical protein
MDLLLIIGPLVSTNQFDTTFRTAADADRILDKEFDI